ncbi:MAG: HEAT repeat domain-containing protein [Verrucomicrobiae bacterium]|nr:HEAT repeat domain-containing protein [Verrucomicrobiae bacterium]
MKTASALCAGLLLTSWLAAPAREAAPRYVFSAGQTNVFAVEVSVRSETGSEVSTGNVVIVVQEAGAGSAKIACRGNLKSDMRRPPQRGPGFFPGYGGYYPGGMMQNVFPNDCEIELNDRGVELRDGGDYVLAVPLGKLVQSIFEPLPENLGDGKSADTVTVLDDPYWLGPANNFMNARLNGQPMGMRFNMGYPQQTVDTLTLSRQVSTRKTAATADSLEWHKQVKLESFTRTGPDPRLVAAVESDFTFDRSAGLMARVETEADVSSQTETTTRKVKVVFKSRRLTGDELEAALAPPPPPAPPRKLSITDLNNISADLKSPDLETRRAALRQLNGVEVETPPADFTGLIAAMALDSDSFTRMTAANFLGSHATTNDVPVLLKLLKDTDWSARQAATKALGRLKDERAIQPLADLIARGGNMYSQDASSALMNIGAPAEKAVIGLLNERNAETQRQACTILQQIGTGDSLDALQKLVGDSEQQTSQAAADAIRAIKQRQ